ncbi:hypothetical protein A3K64_00025 [Candidatus Micrarchaeota archaeon RBG_16_36_9]|nr:MAG: hypothetical protein A3K64_00025 [Candidatus Micrarchaeota archaeon RBG_16_36_9]
MELKRNDYLESQRRKESKLIRESLNEENLNPVSVSQQGCPLVKKKLNPHNYRLYFHFDRKTFNPTEAGFIAKNYGSEQHARDLFNGCKIIVRKETVEVTNLNPSGRWIIIQANSMKEIDERLIEIVDYLDSQCIDALKELIRQYGGFSTFEFKRSPMQENGLKLDDYIDSIPERLVWKDFPFSKKVYKDKVEIYTIEKARTYIKNRALQSFAPEIADEISELRKEQNLLLWIKRKIRSINDVFELRNDIMRLEEKDKAELSHYLFSCILEE